MDAANKISFYDPDSGLILAEKILDLTKKIHFKQGEAGALNICGEAYHFLGDFPQALKLQFEALQINREMKDSFGEGETLGLIGIVYNELGQYRQALQYLMPAAKIYRQLNGDYKGSFELSNIGDAYYFLNIQDSALYYQREAYAVFSENPSEPHLKSFILNHMGDIYVQIGKNDSALELYNAVIQNAQFTNDKLNTTMAQNKIANVYKSTQQFDSAFYYARKALNNAQSIHSKLYLLDSKDLLASLYEQSKNPDSALFYLNAATNLRDSLYGPEKFRQLQLLMLEEQQKQETILRQHEQFRNKIKYIALLSGLVIFLLLAFLLWRNNLHKKKSNILLQKEKQKVEQAYDELKSTQAQLIQSEKMASLGELTAGIAHEIQNPLNFVNNFSEVNKELVDELQNELKAGNANEAIVISNDIKENEEKINHHGKRADAIVKNMLQHSKAGSGQKELTDINALADEYLRLSYHGMRAKNKSFNVELKTDFDEHIGKINIVPQDIGRVLLNLFNNAFYAVSEKAKKGLLTSEGGIRNSHAAYEPLVAVKTSLNPPSGGRGAVVELTVKDNGNGIPQKVLDKIFQPFFTTKPTGEGTGLGLSLSYDIVKAHGGEIKVETKEGEGTEFCVIIEYLRG